MLRRYLSTLQPAGIHRFLRIIRIVTETWIYLTYMFLFFYFNFTLSSSISFTLYIFFKQFIYLDFIITTYPIIPLIHFIPRLFSLTICFIFLILIYFSQLNLKELQYCSRIIIPDNFAFVLHWSWQKPVVRINLIFFNCLTYF